MTRIMTRDPVWKTLVAFTVLLALLGVLVAGGVRSAYGGATGVTFTVTKTADTNDGSCDADCSLREAVVAANAATGDDEITLPSGAYALTIPGANENRSATGDLDITSPVSGSQNDLTITGAGARSTVIDGGGIDRVLHLSLDDDTGGPAVSISGVRVTGGSTAGVPGSSDGGGIQVERSSALTLTEVVVTDNAANFAENSGSHGGGITNFGSLTLRESTVSDNVSLSGGGGIYNRRALEVFNSTINGNSSGGPDPNYSGEGGGILTATGTATVVNSTISGNTSDDDGGGLYNDGVLKLTNVTVAFNTAGGILSVTRPENSLKIKNTIVARNVTGGGAPSNCGGSGITSRGHNLEGGTDCRFTARGDLRNENPRLGALDNNGGPTRTHALLARSPAINAASNAACPATDQRGISRPQGPRCDIGAFERRR